MIYYDGKLTYYMVLHKIHSVVLKTGPYLWLAVCATSCRLLRRDENVTSVFETSTSVFETSTSVFETSMSVFETSTSVFETS